jgi:hypothetical protein
MTHQERNYTCKRIASQLSLGLPAGGVPDNIAAPD